MTKNEYLARLKRCLECIDSGEREAAVQFYSEYFDDAGAENEQRIIEELGSPEKLAREIIAQSESELRAGAQSGTSDHVESFHDIKATLVNARVELEIGSEYRIDVDFPEQVKPPEIAIDNGVLRIVEKPVRRFFGWNSSWRQGVVTITLPDVRYGKFNIESVNGKISVPALRLDSLRCETVNGAAIIDGVSADKLYCSNVNGSASVTGCTVSHDCSCGTVNGSITVSGNMSGTVKLSSVNGSVHYNEAKPLSEYSCSLGTTSGSVYVNGAKQGKSSTITNPSATNSLKVATVNGSIHTSFAQ